MHTNQIKYETIYRFFAPGRVNLIGEHIDYNGGMVLPVAIDLGIQASVVYNSSSVLSLQSDINNHKLLVDLQNLTLESEGGFSEKYVLGVLHLLLEKGIEFQSGMDIQLTSNLPLGSGLSSSAAFAVLLTYVCAYPSDNELLTNVKELTLLAKRVENEFAGVQSGVMDPFVVAAGKKGKAILLNCNNLDDYKYISCLFDESPYDLLILNSNKPRKLVESKYNLRKSESEQALSVLQKTHHPSITSLCDLKQWKEEWLINHPLLKKRTRHIISENQRVEQAVVALQNKDWIGFGKLLNASHASLKTDYEVTGHELDVLAEMSILTDGCIGARMTGAGFGGCAIALVEKNKRTAFIEKMQEIYKEETAYKLSVYKTSACDGVRFEGMDL